MLDFAERNPSIPKEVASKMAMNVTMNYQAQEDSSPRQEQ
jgi:hypothetical protein